MGVLDFLSDLSKASRKDELGLGGMRSLLGTRGAAPEGKRGDEMMNRTSSDSLPGYFDPETREYVPWYVDLFDGGGLNKSEGLLSDAQKVTTAVDMLNTNGAPVQRAGQMAPGLGSQLSDMEMANRNRAAQMAPGLGSQLSDMERMQRANPLEPFGGSGPAIQDTPDTSYYTPPSSMQMPTSAGPGMPSYTPPSSMQMPTPAPAAKPSDSTLNTLRKNVYTVGPIEAMVNAYNNRPDIPLTQPYAGGDDTPRLSEMQTSMMQHPAFPQFVDIMKRMGNESVLQDPSQASFVFNNYLKQIGY
jgi:hypothetical protein